jgi:hypothetical protein
VPMTPRQHRIATLEDRIELTEGRPSQARYVKELEELQAEEQEISRRNEERWDKEGF